MSFISVVVPREKIEEFIVKTDENNIERLIHNQYPGANGVIIDFNTFNNEETHRVMGTLTKMGLYPRKIKISSDIKGEA